MKVAVKLGGFAFSGDWGRSLLKEYVKLFKELVGQYHMVVVTGGGDVARGYINAARDMNVPESLCDQLGILVSRLNARLLIGGLGEYAFPEVPTNVDELKHFFASGKIVVMGGLQPGHSTNAVAAIAAETIQADLFVNITDVEGVYSEDPARNPRAQKLDEVKIPRLNEILSKSDMSAGRYELMDHTALRIIERSKIPTVIIDGRATSNLTKALRNEKVGTWIVHD